MKKKLWYGIILVNIMMMHACSLIPTGEIEQAMKNTLWILDPYDSDNVFDKSIYSGNTLSVHVLGLFIPPNGDVAEKGIDSRNGYNSFTVSEMIDSTGLSSTTCGNSTCIEKNDLKTITSFGAYYKTADVTGGSFSVQYIRYISNKKVYIGASKSSGDTYTLSDDKLSLTGTRGTFKKIVFPYGQ